jgi:protein phosphatase
MDHSYVNEQIATGVERDQLFSGHRFKNAIFRNIGMMPPSEPTTVCGDALRGDVWLMCSDGLSNKMSHADILQIVSEFRVKKVGKLDWFLDAAHALIDLALERGGEDNISVLLFEVH